MLIIKVQSDKDTKAQRLTEIQEKLLFFFFVPLRLLI